MAEVHHFIFNELQVAIRRSVPLKPLLDNLVHYRLISMQEKDVWKSQGKKGMRNLIAKLRGKDFDSFVLFVTCILEAGQKDSSVQTTIVNSIRGAAEAFDEVHKTHFKERIPRRVYDDPDLHDSDEEDDRDSGCASDAPSTPNLVHDRANSIEHANEDSGPAINSNENAVTQSHSKDSMATATTTLEPQNFEVEEVISSEGINFTNTSLLCSFQCNSPGVDRRN